VQLVLDRLGHDCRRPLLHMLHARQAGGAVRDRDHGLSQRDSCRS
jgi:hypothetical protein